MSFFGAIGNAFHSAERSIEHTAKNVAREAAQAERSVVATVHHVEKQVEHAAKVVVQDTVQISKEAKQAFHSVERSIEHTAKNVAHEAARAEKQVVQTVKNPEQTAKQIKTAISKYKESAVAFGTGAGDAALSDVTFGTVQKDSTSNHPVAYKAGEMIGHAVSTLVGMAEVDASTATEVGGFALSGTGVGSLVGVPAMAVAAAGVTHGGLIAAKGTSGLVQSGKDLYQLTVNNEGKAVESTKGTDKATIPTKTDAGSDPANYVNKHAQKHIYDPSSPSTPSKTQYGKDVDVNKLVEDTKQSPDSVENKYQDQENGKNGVTIYSKEYKGNISTNETPTGSHRVIDNHDKPNKSTHFPYVPRE